MEREREASQRPRGARRGRARARGVRTRGAGRCTSLDRPGPRTTQESTIQFSDELPMGQGLHPYKPRRWQPYTAPSVPPAPAPATQPSPSLMEVEVEAAPSLPPQSPSTSYSVPSLAMERETSQRPRGARRERARARGVRTRGAGRCTSLDRPGPRTTQEFKLAQGPSPGSSRHHHLPLHSRQRLDDNMITDRPEYGSEPDSGESDDEELAPMMLQRVRDIDAETPMDPEEDPAPAPADPDQTATDQPSDLYNFDWRPFPNVSIPPELRRERFSDIDVGPTTPCVDPYEIFTSIWDRQFVEYIASETNRYAQQVADQKMRTGVLRPSSRIGRWSDTTADEIYTYLAIVLAMGVVVQTRIEEYWSAADDVFCTPGFRVRMSYDRFILLSRLLHFRNNEDMRTLELDASEAKLFKIQPVLSHLNNKFQSLYSLQQNIALDESLLLWKGWLNINQFIRNKAARVGIKTYEICESQTGYLWRFEVHIHGQRSSSHQPEDTLNTSTTATVLRLVHGLEGKGHTLWMDNFYNSPVLARRLKSIGLDCAGTLRTNRQFVPLTLHSLTKESMRPGQISGLTSGDVDVMVWRDVNRIAMISTYHGNAVQHTQGCTKPILIHDYNIMMGGVDKKDQMLSLYPIERKRTRIWYKKLFRRLLNVSVLNSYIIHYSSVPSFPACKLLNHRQFRKSLINALLSKHCSLSIPRVITPSVVPDSRVDVTHRLAENPFGPQSHQRQRRKCVKCGKRVQTYCVGCRQPVCMDPCFLAIHS